MHRRQSLPRLWLMTDERQGEGLWGALERLPPGSGIVFRHYRLPAAERLALWGRLRDAALGKKLVLLSAGGPLPGADGCHNGRASGIRSASAHNRREIKAAERRGVDLLFLSPIFATATHPEAAPLGPTRFAVLARQATVPVIALGGMNAERAKTLRGAHGWAGIGAWSA